MAAGAIIAGASKEEVAACEVFAEKIGLAFQSELVSGDGADVVYTYGVLHNSPLSQQCIAPITFYLIDLHTLTFAVADDILDVTSTSAELGKTAGKDENTNKATYVKLLGLERSKSEAQRIINEAKSAIEIFGDRAVPLMRIADYIVARKN